MINDATNNVGALEVYLARTTIADEGQEVAAHRTQIKTSSQDREGLNKQITKLKGDAAKLENAAHRRAREARDHVCFRKVYEKKASQAQARVEHKEADTREVELEVTKARKSAEEAITRMREAIARMNDAVADVNTSIRQRT